jgi:hypothetical protein
MKQKLNFSESRICSEEMVKVKPIPKSVDFSAPVQ